MPLAPGENVQGTGRHEVAWCTCGRRVGRVGDNVEGLAEDRPRVNVGEACLTRRRSVHPKHRIRRKGRDAGGETRRAEVDEIVVGEPANIAGAARVDDDEPVRRVDDRLVERPGPTAAGVRQTREGDQPVVGHITVARSAEARFPIASAGHHDMTTVSGDCPSWICLVRRSSVSPRRTRSCTQGLARATGQTPISIRLLPSRYPSASGRRSRRVQRT